MNTSMTTNPQDKASHESKTDDIRAELARFSHATNQQLAKLCESVSAIQARLFSKTDAAQNSVCTAAASAVQHRQQRARITQDAVPMLARDEVLDAIFIFVGIGEYYYVAAVCRNWRGRYLQLCSQLETGTILRFKTCAASIATTAARLQLALDNGLSIELLEKSQWRVSSSIVCCSLEPIAVLTLARVYGLQWNPLLTFYAAVHKKYELLRWLHKCGYPLDLRLIINDADANSNLEHMKQIRALTGPWPAEQVISSMSCAASRYTIWQLLVVEVCTVGTS
jgi:hypothetical protein